MGAVLLACEESQAVCIAFRERGHEAYSCDLQPCSGGHPEWHLQMDVFEAIASRPWDMMIAFPPCTYIANSGARWLFEKEGRWVQLDAACDFFKRLLDAPIEHKGLENPMPHKWGRERIGKKWNQRIHPYHFGDKQKKGTCLWLVNLPCLIPTTPELKPPKDKEAAKAWEAIWRMPPGVDQKKMRSKTFHGIANAMAEQWGCLIEN